MTTVPARFIHHIRSMYGESGAAWLENLGELITFYEKSWSIRVGAPLENLSYNYIAPAVRDDDQQVILKLGHPNEELTSEINALIRFDGKGSVRLLEFDHARGAMLLERLIPGDSLLTIRDDSEATRIAARVMRDLWQPAPVGDDFPTVDRWAMGMRRLRNHFDGGTGPLPEKLVEKAEQLFPDLLSTMGEPVLLHGDLHHENILRANRQPWIAVDPKGVIGEPAYETGALLRNMKQELLAQPDPSHIVARRVESLCDELGFEPQRVLEWGLAQAVLSAWWSIEDHGEFWQHAIRCAGLIYKIMEGSDPG